MKPISNLKMRIVRTAVWSLLAAAMAAWPTLAPAQSTNKPAASTKAVDKKTTSEKKDAGPKSQTIPFHGTLKEVDKAAKTIKVDKRTFEVTSETKKIYRGEKPVTLEDGVVGEYVTGSYTKASDGKLIAHSIYFGGKNKDKK